MRSWNKYFMEIAWAVSKRSKDPSTKVGAVIVSNDHSPISFGYNGFPKGCLEEHMTYERPMKYHTIIHAEMNAILFARRDLKGAILYSTHYPCENCLKHALQAGIREIYYDNDDVLERFSEDQKEAISRLIKATDATFKRVRV